MLDSVDPRSNSELYLLLRPSQARAMVLARDAGAPIFPDVNLTSGGRIGDIRTLVTDALPSGVCMLIDATGLAGDIGPTILDSSDETSLQMDSVGDSPELASTTLISMFQHNMLALKVERSFGIAVLRQSCIASLYSVAW
jgi:hypothetical protein